MPAKPAPVIVLGSVNTDLVVRGERLPCRGETTIGGEFFQALGGKGANQAVAAARAAVAPVLFLAAVGDDDFGRLAVARLGEENLNLDFLKVIPDAATGAALIMVDRAGENQISVASGANALLAPADVDAVPDDVFRQARVLLVSLESPIDTVRRALARAKEAGLVVILNPAPADPLVENMDLPRLVDIITPNEHEAALLTGRQVHDEASCLRAGRALLGHGPACCLITLGAAGAMIVERERQELIAGHRVESIDATAAGDALSGVLAVGIAEGMTPVDALRRANAAAALSVTRLGAQPSLPRRPEIDAFLAAFD